MSDGGDTGSDLPLEAVGPAGDPIVAPAGIATVVGKRNESLLPWLTEIAAAKDLAGYWTRVTRLLGTLSPYHSAVVWSLGAPMLFSGTAATVEATAAADQRALIPYDTWQYQVLAAATAPLSGVSQLRDVQVVTPEELHRSADISRQF